MFFFFKQKTAYELRISDWSSDVCSSDLADGGPDMVDMIGDLRDPGLRLRVRRVPRLQRCRRAVRVAGILRVEPRLLRRAVEPVRAHRGIEEAGQKDDHQDRKSAG